jgi:hypothetical protein
MPDRNIILNELSTISQTVADVPFLPVFTVPENFFAEFPEKMMERIREDAGYETQLLSPLLGGMEKKNPYSVPEGYFANFGENLKKSTVPDVLAGPAPVIRMFSWKKALKLSAAAMVAGIIGISAYLFFQQNSPSVSTAQVNIKAELPKVSEAEMNDFLLSAPDMPQTETLQMAGLDNLDFEDMLKDVQDSELQEFVKEMPDLQPEKFN